MSVAWLWVWVRPQEERARPARALALRFPAARRLALQARAGTRSFNSLGRRWYARLATRLYVLVDPEEVLRIPLVLELHEPRVLLGAVAGTHPLLTLIRLEVQVHAPGREGSHRLGEPPHPVDVPLRVCGVLPACDRVDHIRRVAITSGRSILRDSANCAAVAEEDDLGCGTGDARDLGRVLDVGVDGLIGEPREMHAPVVVQQSWLVERVDDRLECRVGHRLDHIHCGRSELLERSHDLPTLVRLANVDCEYGQNGLAVQMLRDERRGRGLQDNGPCSQLLGCRLHVVAVALDHVFRIVDRVEGQPGQHHRAQLVEAKLIGGHDPEVAAPTTDAPEEILVLLLTRREEPAIGSYHIHRGQVVAGQPPLRRGPAVAASKREAADAGRRHPPPRSGEPEELCLPIELAPQRAGVGTRPERRRVYPNALKA